MISRPPAAKNPHRMRTCIRDGARQDWTGPEPDQNGTRPEPDRTVQLTVQSTVQSIWSGSRPVPVPVPVPVRLKVRLKVRFMASRTEWGTRGYVERGYISWKRKTWETLYVAPTYVACRRSRSAASGLDPKSPLNIKHKQKKTVFI